MKVALFGYGKTTRAIAERFGGGFDFFDDRCKKAWRDDAGNRIYPSSEFDPLHYGLEVLTPSIPPQSPLLHRAHRPVSEYDLFLSPKSIEGLEETPFRELLHTPQPRTVWISGTNGKTTTTQMITHLLKERGALSGGNIGTPLAKLDPQVSLWILETSSYTLHHTRFAFPDLYLLLPVTPDHLDWHGSGEAYASDKLSPLTRMREGELALIPSGLNHPRSSAWIVNYPNNPFLQEYFGLEASRLCYRGAFLQDALLALAVERTLFDRSDYERLNSFRLDRHRQEEIRDSQKRLWVNDSKATNLDAALQALESYKEEKIHLIAGGDDKGVEMEPLILQLKGMNVELYAIGSNSESLQKLAQKHGVRVQAFATLREAQQEVAKRLHPGEVALLSPAASSLDQFRSYAQRGEEFIEFVKALR